MANLVLLCSLHCWVVYLICLNVLSLCVAVTGLHDMDEFVQSQLILAVSLSFTVAFMLTGQKMEFLKLCFGSRICKFVALLELIRTSSFIMLSGHF